MYLRNSKRKTPGTSVLIPLDNWFMKAQTWEWDMSDGLVLHALSRNS